MKEQQKIISVKNIKKYFEIRKGLFRRLDGYVKAVDDVTFDIYKGETFGLVGESGCGKTTLGETITKLLEATEGDIFFNVDDKQYNLTKIKEAEMRSIRKNMHMIFQDPNSSLSPRMTVKEIVAEPLVLNKLVKKKEIETLVADMLKEVDLKPHYMVRYPHAFSGGQKQRVGIARSLIINPKFIVADEPTSALDVSVQAQIIQLLSRLKEEYDLSYLCISHDLSVIKYICDRVGVMYLGKIVELGEVSRIYNNPAHPYTEVLMAAIPKIDPAQKMNTEILEGEVPDPSSAPSGCSFHPRCQYSKAVCKEKTPELNDVSDKNKKTHLVSCHLSEEINLTGI